MLFGALSLLAGCTTAPEQPPSNWSETNQVEQTENPVSFKPIPAVVQTNPPPVILRTNLLLVLRTNLPATKTNLPPVAKTSTNLPPVAKANTNTSTNLPPVVRTNVMTAANTNRPTATNTFKPQPPPVYTWTSLKRWTAEQKMNPPRLITKSPLVAYAVNSDKGVMVLAIGSREATWNGVTMHLGYAPEIIDGEVFVHGLDLQKSLAPLLCDSPLSFGSNRVVVIDPGHGGINAGTISVGDRRPEKEFTLDWARRLQPLLEKEGWQVYLTRTDDVDVALSNRVTVADNRHADLFISLHFNSSAPDQKPAGLATFCMTPVGMPSTVTRDYADAMFQSYPNNYYDVQNMQLAEHLQRFLLHATGLEDRGINWARFMGVLRGQHRPSVLIEAGFLSNPHEAKRIEDPDFRQKLAEAVAAALK
jgi:N-acetylmuramoyl-L-alanine amidase